MRRIVDTIDLNTELKKKKEKKGKELGIRAIIE